MPEKNRTGTVICRMPGCRTEQFVKFENPRAVFEAYRPEEVLTVLESAGNAAEQGGYAAGYITYEAAAAFDSSFAVYRDTVTPLIWFGIYDGYENVDFDDHPGFVMPELDFKSEITDEEYLKAVNVLKEHIYNGDIYQANFTYRLKCDIDLSCSEDYLKMFYTILKHHPVPYAAFVDTGFLKILSFSPELFLEKKNDLIFSRPMKGTAPRGNSPTEDERMKNQLHNDIKNRAENLMIVDMVRNDMGRICRTGSVKTDKMFEVQSFPTVHQMISEVSGKLPENISAAEIFKALFPAASITGAPKIMAMRLINQYESSPRKIYTGSVGTIFPSGDFCFNIAIRTLMVGGKEGELGIGSGIVADSTPEGELSECILKSEFIRQNNIKNFQLLETMLWERGKGFLYLDEHLKRMCSSACRFGWESCSEKLLIEALERCCEVMKNSNAEFMRVRLLFSPETGAVTEFCQMKLKGWRDRNEVKLTISGQRTFSGNIFLKHKTTDRKLYDSSFRNCLKDGYDEIIFFNEKNELTEGAVSNIFIMKAGRWYTPPVECGLLPGIWRAETIKRLNAEVKRLYLEDLTDADKILVGNSVRGGGTGKLHF